MTDPVSQCPRRDRMLSPCRIRPRFELKMPDHFTADIFRGRLDDLKNKTYIRDVCERCGRTVERVS